MPSGFIVIHDGRCYARRWWCYDVVLREVIAELTRDPLERELAAWLGSLLPGPDDEAELGYGVWLRRSDGEIVPRYLDLRQLTEASRRRFNDAARRALARVKAGGGADETPLDCLSPLAEMIERAERGEPPLSMSDWTSVEPPSGERCGPGWDAR